MPRRKKYTFANAKTLAARVDENDACLVFQKLVGDRQTLQTFLCNVCEMYISGTLKFEDSKLVASVVK